VQIAVSEAQCGQSQTVHVGDLVALELPENPSTGYRWTFAEFDGAHLEFVDSGYRAPSRAVGSSGYAYWNFRARSAGNVRIEAKLSRPWEGDRSTSQEFSLDLEIKPPKS